MRRGHSLVTCRNSAPSCRKNALASCHQGGTPYLGFIPVEVLMKLLLLAVALVIAVPTAAIAQKRCVKGKPCGNTCIAVSRTCRVGTPSNMPPPAQAPPAAAPSRQAEPGDSMAWIASSRGQVYYRHGCSNANRLASENRIYFRTEKQAQEAGYRRSTSRGC